jgi:hypothetical protein
MTKRLRYTDVTFKLVRSALQRQDVRQRSPKKNVCAPRAACAGIPHEPCSPPDARARLVNAAAQKRVIAPLLRAANDLNLIVLANGHGALAILLAQLLAQRRTHQHTTLARRGAEVKLARLAPAARDSTNNSETRTTSSRRVRARGPSFFLFSLFFFALHAPPPTGGAIPPTSC